MPWRDGSQWSGKGLLKRKTGGRHRISLAARITSKSYRPPRDRSRLSATCAALSPTFEKHNRDTEGSRNELARA